MLQRLSLDKKIELFSYKLYLSEMLLPGQPSTIPYLFFYVFKNTFTIFVSVFMPANL